METLQLTLPLLRLLQLASPALPVGAYSYSQGMENAVQAGIVHDEASAACWIEDVLRLGVAPCEGRCMVAAMGAAEAGDSTRLCELNAAFLASRESAELRAETVQLGHSLRRLLEQLGTAAGSCVPQLRGLHEPAYPCVWACAACAFGLPRRHALAAYLWAWTENQVLGAVKLVPLGHSSGQRILLRLGKAVSGLAHSGACSEAPWINFAPGLALASSAHETQYTRLFRS